jgi:pimeloyl-ACP methyl ester carboxylesterase
MGLLMCGLLVACRSNSAEVPTATSTSAPASANVIDGGKPVSIANTDISISSADGVQLAGDYFYPPGEQPVPGILLLHMLGSDRYAWEPLVEPLNGNGYAVLMFDLRGHGDSGGSVDWTLAASDVASALAYLRSRPEVDAERTALIGASIGSNLALIAAAEDGKVATAILLSPGLDYRGVVTEPALTDMTQPVLLLASESDSYAADSARTLADLAPDVAQLQIYPGSRHGTRMLQSELDVETQIIGWLADIWR